jgi:hypothetical protein
MPSEEALQQTPSGVRIKRVHFSDITIQEYPIIVCDNPGGNSGCPLSIAWEVLSSTCMSVDEYELSRPPRRSNLQMMVPASCRKDMLRNVGFSRKEISEGTKAANIARARRKTTLQNLHMSKVHERLESSFRTAHWIITLGSKKKHEKALMVQYIALLHPNAAKAGSMCKLTTLHVDTSVTSISSCSNNLY